MSPTLMTLATWVLARAGRGSSSFGGSGRSSGGGFGSSGRGGNGFGTGFLFGFLFSGPGLAIIALLVILFVVFGVLVPRAKKAAEDTRRGVSQRRRDGETRTALAAAADDDEAFDRDHVVAEATRLVTETQEAWDQRDRYRLATLLGPDLLVEWQRRLDDYERRRWHDRVTVTGEPQIRIMGLVNRADDADDRVVVHVRAPIESWADTPNGRIFPDGQLTPRATLSEYWTLGKREHPEGGSGWVLLSIEQDAEGDHHLRSKVVTGVDDDPDVSDDARTELAVADAAGDASSVAQLVSADLSEDARAAALDLSLVDDRFSPDVLTIAVGRAAAAWAEAIDGSDDHLERLASPAAVRSLLYADAGEGVRTVVRGPRVDDATIDRLSAGDEGAGEAPRMEVAVRYTARWYREDRDTAEVLAGSRERETTRIDRWTFELTDDATTPWRLVGAA